MGGGLERSGWDKKRGVDMDTDAQLLWFVVVGKRTPTQCQWAVLATFLLLGPQTIVFVVQRLY